MAVTAAEIKAFAPDFADVADSVIDQWIAWAPGYVAPRRFPGCEDQAVTLWVCHQLARTSQGSGGTAGPVTLDKVGDVERQNGELKGLLGENMWATTGWGQTLLQLARRFTAGGLCL